MVNMYFLWYKMVCLNISVLGEAHWLKLIQFFFFFCKHTFLPPSEIKSGIAGLHGNCLFSFTRNYFPEWWYHVTSHQQCMSDPVFPHLSQHLVVFLFFILVMRGRQRHLIVVLVCVCLMVNDVKHLPCTCLPSVCPLWSVCSCRMLIFQVYICLWASNFSNISCF